MGHPEPFWANEKKRRRGLRACGRTLREGHGFTRAISATAMDGFIAAEVCFSILQILFCADKKMPSGDLRRLWRIRRTISPESERLLTHNTLFTL